MSKLADAVNAASHPGIQPLVMPDPEADRLAAALREALLRLADAWAARLDDPEAPAAPEPVTGSAPTMCPAGSTGSLRSACAADTPPTVRSTPSSTPFGPGRAAMPDPTLTPRTPAMLVLRPGDKVLVTLAEDPGVDGCEGILRSLKASFPGVEFTVLAGVTGLAVAPPD